MINGVSPPPPGLRIKTTKSTLPPGLGRNLRLFAAENLDNSPSSTHYSDCGERFFHCDDSSYCSANSFGSPFGTCNDFLDSEIGSLKSMSFHEDRSLERFEPGYETEGSQLRSFMRSRRKFGVNLQGMEDFTAAQDYLPETQELYREFDNGSLSTDETGERGVSIRGFQQLPQNLLQKPHAATSDSVHQAVQETLENSGHKAIDCLHQHGFQPRGFESEHDEEGNGGSAIQGELSAITLRTLEVSSLSEKLSDLDSQSDFDSMMGDATDDEDASYLAKRNSSLHPATTQNGTGKNNPLLLNSEVVFGAGDWDEFDREVGGHDLQVAELEAESNELETVDVREDIGGASKLKAADDCSGPLGGIADKLAYEDELRTRFELTSLCTSSGSGRPDLEEDDSSELLRVKDHFQRMDKFHSDIGNDGNSFLKTNDYMKGDIGLSSKLLNSPQHFSFAKEEERKLSLQKPRIQAFCPDGNRDASFLQASHINLEDIHHENELECLSDTEEMEEKEENCLKCHELSRQSNSETNMSLVPLVDAKTSYSPTAAVQNTVDKTQRVEGNSESFLPWTSEPRDVYFCDTNLNTQANDANDWGKEDLGPDELSRYVEVLDVNESYVDTVHDMEEVLLDSGESGGRFVQLHTKGGLSGHSCRGYMDGVLGASTSGVDSAYPHMQYIQKFDWIEVVGAKQRKGASFGERLVGVKEYTVYQIRVHSGRNQWEIERRFRDFLGLYRQLKNTFSAQGRGNLPSPWELVEKDSYKIFGNASPDVVSERSVLIQECLLSLLRAGSPFDSLRPLFWFLLPQKSFLESPASLEGNAHTNMQRVSNGERSSFQSHEGMSPGLITKDYKHGDKEETSAFGKTIRLIVQIHPHKSLKQLLEAQHYSCAGCYKHLDVAKSLMEELVQTLGWGKPRLCEYMGQLFCSSCHSNETAVLPARVLQHWDFTPCPVSQLAKAYLDSIYDQPMLCVSAVNPFIFSRVSVLVHVMEMRKKLSRMLACIRCPCRTSIQRSLGSRRYLLENSDFFALRDLVDLSKGAFAALPSLMETLCQKIYVHITQQCSICREVGELCGAHLKCEKRSSLIFPFQDGEVMRCESCGSVFHRSCFRKSGGCPCSLSDHTNDDHATSPLCDELDVKPYIQNDSISDLKASSDSSLNMQGSTSSKGFFIDLFQKATPETIWKPKKKSGVLNMASLSSSLGL